MTSLKGKRIFIVEDNFDNRKLMQLALAPTGATLAFDVWGAQTVIHLLAHWPIDVVLLDLMFPRNINGFDVYDKIRAEPRFGHLPIVAVSASDISSALPKCRSKGFSGFIPKPIDIDLFPEQISRIIQGDQVWYIED